jgi:hypothetical protein
MSSAPAVPTPAWVGLLLERLAAEASAIVPVVGLYLHGSLVLDDFQDGRSDLDVVAVLTRPASDTEQSRLAAMHRRFTAEDARAAALHCAYVDGSSIGEVSRVHPAWAHVRWLSRPLSVFARRELQAVGRNVLGPPISTVLPALTIPVTVEALEAEWRYWRRRSYSPHLWWQDIWVDIGLTSAVRERVWRSDTRAISKTEAIARMPDLGVPIWLVDDMQRRRSGRAERPTAQVRVQRIWTAPRELRRLMPDPSGGGSKSRR